jgi:hypothetical protein
LRRRDDAVEIAGDSSAAHYLGKYVTVDGIKFPTERRVYVAGPDGRTSVAATTSAHATWAR